MRSAESRQRTRGSALSQVLYVVPDCPGFFTQMAAMLAHRLRESGHEPVFAVTSRYYEHFKGVHLSAIGPVHYVSEFLRECPDADAEGVPLNYWLAHATFVRTRFYWGRHINSWHDYRKVVLFFRSIFDRYPQLRLVWCEIPSNSVNCIAHAVATERGIPYLGFASARVPDRFTIATDLYASELLANPDSIQRPADGQPDYMRYATAPGPLAPIARAVQDAPARVLRAFSGAGERSVETGSTPALQLKALAREVYRRIYYRTRISRDLFSEPPSRESAELGVIFPLHYRPEASTSVQARFYEDDLETLRIVAFSLPHRARLYVKEHPSAVGMRSRDFYKRLLSYPAVHLLDANPPLSKYIRQLDAMVTLTSTAGFEAIQQGLPVLLLGRSFYETYPGVIRIENWSQLERTLASMAPGGLPRPTEEPMRRYLRACFPGTFNYMWEGSTTPANIDQLAKPVLACLSSSTMTAAH